MVSEDFLFSVCLAGHLILFASLNPCEIGYSKSRMGTEITEGMFFF